MRPCSTSRAFAKVLRATRDDELLTRSLGFGVTAHKVFAFALSAAVAALAGVMYAWFIRYISPGPFSFFAASFPAFVLVAVGGPGTVWGPVVGATFLTGFPEFLEMDPNSKLMIYGAVLLFVIVVLPTGIVPSLGAAWRRLRHAAPTSAPPNPPPIQTETDDDHRRDVEHGSEPAGVRRS